MKKQSDNKDKSMTATEINRRMEEWLNHKDKRLESALQKLLDPYIVRLGNIIIKLEEERQMSIEAGIARFFDEEDRVGDFVFMVREEDPEDLEGYYEKLHFMETNLFTGVISFWLDIYEMWEDESYFFGYNGNCFPESKTIAKAWNSWMEGCNSKETTYYTKDSKVVVLSEGHIILIEKTFNKGNIITHISQH